MSELFGPLQAAGPVAAATDDTAWLQALLDSEAALAWALADRGIIPETHAGAIAAACRAELYDAREIGAAAVDIGNPAAPLVRALTARVTDREAAGSVHLGATSQDIMDSAAMLIAARALDALEADLSACADLLAELTRQHAATPQVGRSLLQQALPVTFGLTAAGWLSSLGAAADQLDRVHRSRLAAQLGGAVGTLASLGDSGTDVMEAYARRLGLTAPELPWHTDRSRISELAGALGTVSGVVAKIGRDLTLLAQTEVGEVGEDGAAGGSSTMPHKRNPIAAVAAVAAAAQAPGLVATLLSASGHEQQRAAGSWHAEWRPLTELLRSTGAAVHWLRESLSRLQIHPARMRGNLALTGGLLMAERVTAALTPALGRLAAHDAVTDCARRVRPDSAAFGDLLAAHPLIAGHLDRSRIDALLEPSAYLGSAPTFVQRALSAHEQGRIRTRRMRGGGDGGPGSLAGTRATRAVTVHHLDDGDPGGIPVVLINALGSTLEIWSDYVQPLQDSGFRVVRYDARGHGDSPVPAGPYGLADLGADLEALLNRLEIEAAHLVGVSLGGMTALWLARYRPERVRGLVACCTSARPGNAERWRERAAQAGAQGMRAIAEGSVERWFTPEWRAEYPETTRHMRDLTTDTPAHGYAACCAALADLDLSGELPHITAPTLVLSTVQDPAFPPEHGRLIADRIPGARLEILDGAAHLGPTERPDLFLPPILDHLRGAQ
ncbi:3-carboxy-cis,cis-muconate cycloisomerase [Nocardia sp. CA-151230]|uniref:3-carboxy-cis,cis-muconate cycloisomerase n=1 Tax=Nocardia sp. CA-151230 TaxID=3239982 RepID=UPI003D937970